MKAQIFSNKGLKVHCDTFNCLNIAYYFIGNPVGPLMKHINLCEQCRESLINTLIDQDRKGLLERIEALEATDRITKEKDEHGGKEFPCKHCGEVFWSPRTLGAHTKNCAAKQKEVEA